MARYYRIQPAGLGIDHHSESSEGPADGLDVFRHAYETTATDCGYKAYGDEIVVIEAEGHWANGDVEGVRIDGSKAKIVARYSVAQWRAAWLKVHPRGLGSVDTESKFWKALRRVMK